MLQRSLTRRCLVGALLAASLCLLPYVTVQARFIRADLKKVPVAKLVKNLEAMVAEKPKDTRLLYNLARVHAMAYALKSDTATIHRKRVKNGWWFGYTPKYIPFKMVKTNDPVKKQQAQVHLKQALALYAQIMKQQPQHLGAQLGHAWLTQQDGRDMQALLEYRRVVKNAWAVDGKRRSGPIGGNYVTVEAANYLIPMLDKKKDAKEIDTLKQRIAHLRKLRRPITPIAIPLRDNLTANDMVNRSARVTFDADGSGLAKQWTWIHPNAAWLVHDPKHTGKITSALQMFGNVTFWLFWDNGYQALVVLDDDGNGFIDGNELNALALWHDVNGNGRSEPGEVKSLRQYGITKLSCLYVTDSLTGNCAAHAQRGVYFRDGNVRPTYDVILRRP